MEGDLELEDISDREFQALVDNLLESHPTVTSPGFDLRKVKGNIRKKTGKAIVLQLALAGWTVSEIATAVGVKQATVDRQLEEAIRDAAPVNDVELLRDFELQKLISYERMCLEEFERSKKPKVTRTVFDEFGEKESITCKTEGQTGNPNYLRLLLEINKRKAALLGLDQPARISIDKTTRQLVVTEVVVSTAEDAIMAKKAGLLK